ncbi:MAG: proton-conducting transporter membrane subunit, partial [Candidatus Margulisbacteria bacterium]|nr:proton-conducting transporter membrane subunit [Candidatus Margulisiibacteriota bacterium]
AFILLAIAAFGALIALYSAVFMSDRPFAKQFFSYLLLTIAFSNGAVLADNLILFLFFWEGLLLTLFGMIIIGRKEAFKTAIKAFVIVGITDLCLMFGLILTGWLAGTFTMSEINLPLGGLASLAFVFMMIGAVAKAGSMPFHTWIPDAALDAPLPFMALVPAAIEKLLGIYFLARISLDLFKLEPGSWISMMMMILGALTILLAVMMALVQKDYKKLLSYHAISQVGYMILGIGTAVPVGIVGGIFHMINHAMYKSCLFLTGGSVEKQTGTTDLSKLGGLFSKMPITMICFAVAAASISGVPPFNGFFSKELIYDGALERGWIFYLAAVLGSVLTAASFLKLGHAAYFDKETEATRSAKEASWPMLLPMIVIAGFCILFGVYNPLPLNHLIQPILGARLEGHGYAGLPGNWWLVLGTVIALTIAVLNHLYGVKRTGKGIGASDHIHYAPGLSTVYDLADKKYFDPYDVGMKLAGGLSLILFWIDRFIDWLYETVIVGITMVFSAIVRWFHSGNISNYVVWSLVGAAVVIYCVLR